MAEFDRKIHYGADANAFFHFGKGTTTNVVVVGGGIVGPAATHWLERLNPQAKIVMLEASSDFAQGAPANSAECLRVAWSPQCIAQMALFSHEVITHANDYFGEEAAEKIGFKNRGYLYLAMNQDEAIALQKSVALMQSWGLPNIYFLDQQQVMEAYPWLPPHIAGAKIDANAGWLSAHGLAHVYAESCRSAQFVMETTANRIIVRGDQVIGVETSRGIINTDYVVVAAGPGSRTLAKSAGIDLPLVSVPRQGFVSSYRHDAIPADAPMVIAGRPDYPYFRPDENGLLFGCAYDDDLEGNPVPQFAEPTGDIRRFKEQGYPARVLNDLQTQFGYKEGTGFDDGTYLKSIKAHNIGYYVYAVRGGKRSERAIIDKSPVRGVFFEVGNAGHGIMTSPGAAMIVASLVWDKTPSIPLWHQFGLHVDVVEHEEKSGL